MSKHAAGRAFVTAAEHRCSNGSSLHKQVTVLFADVVGSMDIAGALGPERLRELMTDVVTRTGAVVRRYDGTLNQFTGDA